LITIVIVFGAFISVMDVSVVNVALPHMRGAFGVDLSSITWVATSYTISQIIMITMSGWWSTLLGRKRFYLASYLLFTIGSILAGTANSLSEMIVYRIIQGAGGGPLIPISQAILRETYPQRQQGMAMAIFGMGVVLAPAMGPVLGGWLTENYGWPWVFYINIPFCAIGMWLVKAFVEDPPYLRRGIRKVDWMGIFLLGMALVGLQVVLERGQEENWFESAWIVSLTAITLLSLAILVIWELQVPEPIIDFRVLRSLYLSVGSAITLVFGLALFGSTFLLPQFLQNLMGYTAFNAGEVLIPRGIALFFMLPIVGWVFNFVGARILIFFGTAMIVYSFLLLSRLSLDAGYWNLVTPMIFMGIGMPCFFVTLSTVSFFGIRPEDSTSASSLFNLARRVGGNLGYALLTTILERRTAYHRVSLVSFVTEFNESFIEYRSKLISILSRQVGDPFAVQAKALFLIDRMVNRQSTMLAYNDVYFYMVLMFVGVLPLIFLLPGRRQLSAS
jgi:DHA2 family multidrug resistance protein